MIRNFLKTVLWIFDSKKQCLLWVSSKQARRSAPFERGVELPHSPSPCWPSFPLKRFSCWGAVRRFGSLCVRTAAPPSQLKPFGELCAFIQVLMEEISSALHLTCSLCEKRANLRRCVYYAFDEAPYLPINCGYRNKTSDKRYYYAENGFLITRVKRGDGDSLWIVGTSIRKASTFVWSTSKRTLLAIPFAINLFQLRYEFGIV